MRFSVVVISMRKSHELLLRLYHDPQYYFEGVKIEYLNRGAENDTSCISGVQVVRLDSQYIEVIGMPQNTYIPYHRVRRIVYNNKEMWNIESATSPNRAR